MVWDFLLPYGNRKIKCNSPVDCCLPPARWRQHLCRRPFPDGDANDSRTGHRKNLPGACFLGRGRFHRSESAAGTAVKSERFICFASRRSRLDGADTFGPTRFVIALIIATFLDFAFCISCVSTINPNSFALTESLRRFCFLLLKCGETGGIMV